MNLVIADESNEPITMVSDFDIDAQYGNDSNEFTLDIYDEIEVDKFYRWWVDGTSFGGIIKKLCPQQSGDISTVSFKGKTLQGILEAHIITPPSGSSHLSVSGDANEVLRQVIQAVGLSDFFSVPEEDSGIVISSYRFYRFIDAYTGLRMMATSNQARLKFDCVNNQFQISVVNRDLYGDIESEKMDFSVERDYLPINHLIGLGKGEGTSRAISHWYADFLGNLSQKQALFGEYENAKTYALTSEESDSLSTKTKNKLKEYQDASEAKFNLPDAVSLDVDDVVVFSNARYGISAQTSVSSVILKASNGVSEISYEFGQADWPEDEE